MGFPECATPDLLGRPCDIERASIISGRESERIIKLEERMIRFSEVVLPESVAELDDWPSAQMAYLEACSGGTEESNNQAVQILFRLIQLASLEDQLGLLARRIPRDGGPLECYYLKRVVEICPGE